MQTFLPYKDFNKTAKVLDNKRLFKQLVETRQILSANNFVVYKNDGSLYGISHKNHPAVKMWNGCDIALCKYHNIILNECLHRGIKTKIKPFNIKQKIKYPEWIGNEDFHKAHRSNLLRKDAQFYGQYDWSEPDNLPYIWPVE